MAQSFTDALNELMDGRGISNNELARLIDVDPAQIGRWRKGRGRPRPENLVRAAAVFGVEHTWLWTLAYPHGMPASEGPLHPRLAAFLAQIEAAFVAMSPQEWEVRENAGRALFAVPTSTSAKSDSNWGAKTPQHAHSGASSDSGDGPDATLEHRKRGVRVLAFAGI